jgi:hypothetical protein
VCMKTSVVSKRSIAASSGSSPVCTFAEPAVGGSRVVQQLLHGVDVHLPGGDRVDRHAWAAAQLDCGAGGTRPYAAARAPAAG